MYNIAKKWKSVLLGIILAVTVLPLQAESVDNEINNWSQSATETLRSGNIRKGKVLPLGHQKSREHLVGLRFENIAIPNGATITNAYLSFTAVKNADNSANFVISAESVDNAPALKRERYDLSRRSKTEIKYYWDSISEWVKNNQYRTGDLSPVIQELINREGWKKSGAMLFFVEAGDTCREEKCNRLAKSYRKRKGGSPSLHIEFETSEGNNKRPVAETTPSNWYIRLVAEDPERAMESANAQLGSLDREDAEQKYALKALTPFGGSYLDIVFVDPDNVEVGEYKSNFHITQENTGKRWRFTVKTDDPNADILLRWRGVYVLSPYSDKQNRQRYREYRSITNPIIGKMKLIDNSNGKELAVAVDGKVQIYSFNMSGEKERNFEWVLEANEVEQPVQSAAVSASPQLSSLKAKAVRKDAAITRKAMAKKGINTSFDLKNPPKIKSFNVKTEK